MPSYQENVAHPPSQPIQNRAFSGSASYQSTQHLPPTAPPTIHQPNRNFPTNAIYTDPNFPSSHIYDNSQQQGTNRYQGIPPAMQTTFADPSTTPSQSLPSTQEFNYQPYGDPNVNMLYPNTSIVPVDPAYIQCTNTFLPRSEGHVETKLPVACVCQPLCQDSQTEIPLVQFPKDILRCRRCKGYINPFVKWQGYARWTCNMCGTDNITPKEYINEMGSGGKMMQRAELNHSSIEIQASEDYTTRSPQDPAYIFLIHLHKDMGQSGALTYITDCIRDHLDELPGGNRCRVMLLTYDSTLHFYRFVEGAENPEILHVPDVSDVILPCPPSECFINRSDFKELLTKMLENLQSVSSGTTETGNCLLDAIKIAMKTVAHIGGKMIIFNWGRPNIGEAKMEDRLKGIPLNDVERLHNLQLSGNRQVEDYYIAAIEATKLQISIDLYQFTGLDDEFVDLPTLRELSQFNGGYLRFYPRYTNDDGARLYLDIQRNLTRETGWEAVMRVRCSHGHATRNYIGSFHRKVRDLLCIPVVHADTTIAMEIVLKNPDSSVKENVAYLQAVLLYTSSTGQRIIRVHNMPIMIATSKHDLWNGVNMSATTNWLARQAAMRLTMTPLARGRLSIQDAVTNVCRVYKEQTRTRLQRAEDYPVSWCSWPLITLGMLKSVAFRDEPIVNVDERSAMFFNLWTATPQATDLLFRPSLYPLHELINNDSLGVWNGDVFSLPEEVSGGVQSLRKDGLYLLDDADVLVLWCGDHLKLEIVDELFITFTKHGSLFPDVQSLKLRSYSPGAEENLGNDLSGSLLSRVWNILEYLRSMNQGRAQKILACCSRTSTDITEFTYRLYEDRTENVMSYTEIMSYLR